MFLRVLGVGPGDEVITFAPFFPEYKQYVNRTGAVLKVVPADTKQFQINFEALESMINENTAVILINTPNNPSGTVYSTQTLTRLAQLLNDKQKDYGHDIFIVSDEPYRRALCIQILRQYTFLLFLFQILIAAW